MDFKQSLQYLAALLILGAITLLALALGMSTTRGLDVSTASTTMVLGIAGVIVAVLALVAFLVSRKI